MEQDGWNILDTSGMERWEVIIRFRIFMHTHLYGLIYWI